MSRVQTLGDTVGAGPLGELELKQPVQGGRPWREGKEETGDRRKVCSAGDVCHCAPRGTAD